MISHIRMHRYLVTVLMCLTSLASLPALAEESAVEEVIAVTPGVTQLLGRILDDPHRDYDRVRGPDDCRSEDLYHSTENILREYVATPAEKKAEVRDFILSGEAACNCTRAILGKEINSLVNDIGMKMDELPCL
jgi:hypothetical protein